MKNDSLLLAANLGENGHVAFRNHEEIAEWAGSEIQHWRWLTEGTNDPALGQAWNIISKPLVTIRKINEQARNQIESDNYGSTIKALHEAFAVLANEDSIPVSSSSRGEFVSELRREKGDRVGAYALAMFLKVGVGANNPDSIQGVIDAVLFERGVHGAAQAEKKSLAKTKTQMSALWKEYRGRLDSLSESYESLHSSAEDNLTRIREESKGLFQDFQEHFEDFKGQSETEWDGIKRAFNDQMALQAPVDYWSQRESAHRGESRVYAIVAAISALAGFVLLFLTTQWLLNVADGNSGPEGTKYVGSFLGIPLWRIAVFTVFASGIAWLMRILVKLLFNAIHLKIDAAERVVMAKTYLALLKEGTG